MGTKKRNTVLSTSSLIALLATTSICFANAPATGYEEEPDEIQLSHRKISGPRLGITYVAHNSTWEEKLDEKGIDNFISQFGWHLEWMVKPQSGGPAFVTELMPFIGGVEYGTVIPNLSLVFGIRFPRGFEFGMGPQVVVTLDKREPVSSSLVVGLGQTLDFSGVKIPLNLAMATNRSGQRLSFVFGYALNRRR